MKSYFRITLLPRVRQLEDVYLVCIKVLLMLIYCCSSVSNVLNPSSVPRITTSMVQLSHMSKLLVADPANEAEPWSASQSMVYTTPSEPGWTDNAGMRI